MQQAGITDLFASHWELLRPGNYPAVVPEAGLEAVRPACVALCIIMDGGEGQAGSSRRACRQGRSCGQQLGVR